MTPEERQQWEEDETARSDFTSVDKCAGDQCTCKRAAYQPEGGA